MKRNRKARAPLRRPRKRLFLRRIFYILLPLLLATTGLFYWFYNIGLLQTLILPPTPQKTLISPSPTQTNTSRPIPLSSEEYRSIRADLEALVDKENPKIALARLEELSEINASTLRSCHALVHEIGHQAFKKYNDVGKAFAYQNEVCGSGYLHGIIEAYFNDTPNVLEKMPTLCSSYGLSAVAQRCYHAVGHGLMFYSQNDLPASVRNCSLYQGRPRIRCLEGVYMENFNTDQKLHPSVYLSASDPFYPCNEQTAQGKAVCYFYAPLYYLNLHQDNYSGALNWCKTAPKAYSNACTTGLATRIMKQNIKNPKLVEKLCMEASGEQRAACIDGMVSYYFVNFDSFIKTDRMCQTLEQSNQGLCQQSLVRRKNSQ